MKCLRAHAPWVGHVTGRTARVHESLQVSVDWEPGSYWVHAGPGVLESALEEMQNISKNLRAEAAAEDWLVRRIMLVHECSVETARAFLQWCFAQMAPSPYRIQWPPHHWKMMFYSDFAGWRRDHWHPGVQ